MSGYSIPPQRELAPARLAVRRQHLLAEIEAGGRRRLPVRATALAAATAAAAVSLLLVAPWASGPSLTDRALAAVGDGPVFHVTVEGDTPYTWFKPVSIATGAPIHVTFRREVWLDSSRGLEKTVESVDSRPISEVLETPEGWFTPEGPVYTCAWIAAHPVEATKARVSCHENMENGTTPHHIPESPPTPLDPAFAGFVDHYRSALASGEAKEAGTGRIEGRDVIWLRIRDEDVAIDADSYRPVVVRNGKESLRVEEIGTQLYDPTVFARPAPGPPRPSIGAVKNPSPIDLSEARRLLGGQALWLGPSWHGLSLVGVVRQDLVTGYGPLSDREPTHSTGVSFQYGGQPGHPALTISEATQCELAYGWMCGDPRMPAEGTMLAFPTGFGSFLRVDGLYVHIGQAGTQPPPLDVARALTAVPKAS